MDYKYDRKSKRFTQAKDEEVTPAETESIRVDKTLIDKLVGFAKEDGFDLEGTKQSKGIKRNKVIRVYAEMALFEFIEARK